MIRLVKIISTSIDGLVRFVKFYYRGRSDIRNAPEFAPFGIDGNPLKDTVAICVQTGQDGKTFVVGYLNKNQFAEPGELRLFSMDATGTEKTYQWFKKDGTIEILGNNDNLVRYSKTEEAFNQLKSDRDATDAAFAAHTAAVAVILGTPVYVSVPSTANIIPAKINEIKTLQ